MEVHTMKLGWESQRHVTVATKSSPEGLVSWRDSSLTSVCRQIHDEWKTRNPRSRNISLRIADVNDYIQTFLPPTERLGEKTAIMLIKLSTNDPNLEVSFSLTRAYPWRSDNELTRLTTTLIARQALASPESARPIVGSAISALSTLGIDPTRLPPIPARISRVNAVWRGAGSIIYSQDALIFMFDPSDAASWMNGDWTYVANIKAMMSNLEQGIIPPGYLSEEDHLRCTFWKSLGLQELSPAWRIRIGVEDQENFQLSKPGKLGLGWVWDHDEIEEISDHSSDDEFAYPASKDGENNVGEEGRTVQEELESEEDYLEYEEEESDGEELSEELA
ncbi:hypothetical protein P171DRAFT_440274 [Karstenula rhodostoma CBS 690.94]|uniref:Uncharacterized protein n=1 Tax=Karstenula rhodostoma CBS 690.94 TaxID=1392251 RepID=A0A9P4UH58_9PLEO|nr:hypothetical protein P171DRAFT_440274 [Karstenula rhodostoma CBS 690.94]